MTRRLRASSAAVRAVAILMLGAASAQAQAPSVPVPLPTPAEQAGYLSFTAPDEVGPYLGRLAAAAEGVTVDSLRAPAPIPIVRIAPIRPDSEEPDGDEPAAAPEAPIVRVLVLGAQHGTERAGIEVGLRIARDLATGRLASLRGSLEVRIVPMANPWGVSNRRAETADGVDMNGDHLRLAAPETRALWAEYTAWRPHLVLDLHEIGPSEYTVQVGVPTHPNAPGAAMFARFYLLPFVANELAGSDIRFHEYVAEWSNGRALEGAALPSDPHAASGDADDDGEADDAGAWFTPPPLDPASARNAFALAGSVAYFVAVSSSRDIIGLEERTERLYITVRALLAAAGGLAPDLVAAHDAAVRLPKDALALRPRYVAKRPDASLPWIFANPRGQREQGLLAPWRSDVAIDLELEPPSGWWLDADEVGLADALRAHGFEVSEGVGGASARDRLLAYPRCVPRAPDSANTGGDTLGAADASRFLRPVSDAPPEGALWVNADQPGGRLLYTLVEPWSTGSWFDRGPGESGAERGDDPADLSPADPTPACDEAATFPLVRVSG